MKRIVFVRRASGYSLGGANRRLLDWLSEIDYSKSQVSVVSPVDVFSNRIREEGIRAGCIVLSPEENNALFGHYDPVSGSDELATGTFLRFFVPWLRFLLRLRPDQVVLMQGYFFSFPLACVLAAYIATRGRVYMTEHSALLQGPPAKTTRRHFGLFPGLGLWWYRKVWPSVWPWRLRASLCRRILAASDTVKDREVAFYGYPPNKMGIINHGVDVARFAPSRASRAQWRVRHGIPAGDVVLVSTGRLHAQKRIDRLLKAFLAVAAERSDLWLILAGDGPAKPDVEALIRSYGDEPPIRRIMLLGHVEDVPPVLQASDIYVLSSDTEGFGIALVEAMATGLVCVSTETEGPQEIVTNGDDAFLVALSEGGLIRGLRKALQMSPGERSRMGERARQTVVAKYGVRSAVSNALRLLNIEMRKDIPEALERRTGRPLAPVA